MLSERPGNMMVVSPNKFPMLEEAFATASEKGVLTARYSGIVLKEIEELTWLLEIPNMIVKYYTTTEGMKKAMEP
ncbi:MAG: hypothetical protein K8R52_06640 [Bacteroidales bacterium]|nr:hypothetical protein [Bacteroidales bacterium]